jgi:chromosomal replication initiation ATPase DnaA
LVCEEFDVTWEDIISKKRQRNIVRARQFYCYFSRVYLKKMHKVIYTEVNYKDHSDVIHCINTIDDLLETHDVSVLIPFKNIKRKFLYEHQA